MKTIKKIAKAVDFNVVDLLVLIFFILFMLYFGSIIVKDAHAQFTQPSWKAEMAEEIADAYFIYVNKINDNPTDMGCTLAERKLLQKIDFILFHYKFQISNNKDDDLDR